MQDFAEQTNPKVGYEVTEAPGDEIIPLEEVPVDNQKIVVLMILFVKATKTASLLKLLRYLPHSKLLQDAEKHPR